ncbi:ark1 [Symbiodinium microadriaticum]|nr:ark1 [Symbiodinium microadriaticum]
MVMAGSSRARELKVCFFLFLLAGKEVYVVNAERTAVDVFTEVADLQQAAASIKEINRHGAEPLCDGLLFGCINPRICTGSGTVSEPCAVKADADLATGYATDVGAVSTKIDSYKESQSLAELSIIAYELKDLEQYDKVLAENKGGPLLKSKITELADKVDHSMETLAAAMPKDSFCSMVDLVSGLNDAKSRGQGATGSPDESKAFLKKVFPGITDEDVSTIMTRADEEAQEVLDCDTSTPNCREERLMKQDDKFLKQVDSLAENLAESEASFVQLATKFGANVPHDHLSELTEMQRRENTWAALQIMDNKTAWEELKQAAHRHDASSALQNGVALSKEESFQAQLEAGTNPIVVGIIIIVVAILALIFLTAAVLIPILLVFLGLVTVGIAVKSRRR